MKKLFLKGKSMKPFFKEGDILVYQKINNILKNDVVVFQMEKSSESVVHRVIEVKILNNDRIFITKGDNAKYPDKPVYVDQILGLVTGKIKNGKFIKISRKKEKIKSFLALIYLRTKLILYKILYHLNPIIFKLSLSKFIKMSFIQKEDQYEYYFFNKKVAIYNKEQHNYQWIHYCFIKNTERFINFINKNMSEKKLNVMKRNPDIVYRTEDDEGLIYNPKTGEMKILNETACFMYSLLDGKKSKEDIVDKLINEYDIEKEIAIKDVENFLKDLSEKKLI